MSTQSTDSRKRSRVSAAERWQVGLNERQSDLLADIMTRRPEGHYTTIVRQPGDQTAVRFLDGGRGVEYVITASGTIYSHIYPIAGHEHR